jgi:hypothetical protein
MINALYVQGCVSDLSSTSIFAITLFYCLGGGKVSGGLWSVMVTCFVSVDDQGFTWYGLLVDDLHHVAKHDVSGTTYPEAILLMGLLLTCVNLALLVYYGLGSSMVVRVP